jgi:hypothetical protein
MPFEPAVLQSVSRDGLIEVGYGLIGQKRYVPLAIGVIHVLVHVRQSADQFVKVRSNLSISICNSS